MSPEHARHWREPKPESFPQVEALADGRLLLRIGWQRKNERFIALGTFPSATVNPNNGWTPQTLHRAAVLAVAREVSQQSCTALEREIQQVSKNLTSTYEEISLLHGLTRRLQLSNSQRELSDLALDWLSDCLPAEAIFIHYQPQVESNEGESVEAEHIQPLFLSVGNCTLDLSERQRFAELLDPHNDYVRGDGEVDGVRFKGVRQYLAVPLRERGKCLGWLVAINNKENDSFSSIEGSLLRSVSTILGIHFANREHYEEQTNLVAEVVRALASAIDAKDPYTRGHSDRVANISVVLARTLGADDETLRTLYIGGLLHDIGKIGVDDEVLRKDGKLTDEEFDQIKQHPELGYQILADLKPLKDVLPIVLHHHERWDGHGYPDQIGGEDIEFLARIAAVADSFDAMTSDRPYRKGMPVEKVEQILREGAGSQWDPQVIEAFFQARDEIVGMIWQQEVLPLPEAATP